MGSCQVDLACAYCGATFSVPEWRVRQGRKFCSLSCWSRTMNAGRPPTAPSIGSMVPCIDCQEPLVVTARHASTGKYRCVPCRWTLDRAYRDQRRVMRATRLRARNDDERRRYQREYRRRKRAESPVKQLAREALDRAVRSGKVVRQPCADCGSARSHGHHSDYSKPLDVEWVCARCHGRRHWKEVAS